MRPIERERFEVGGEDLGAFRVRGAGGMELRATPLGGAILSLSVPDREGRLADVVLGYDDPQAYATNPSYMGVVCGRFANRIAGARFAIDGREHRLDANDGPNQLHGGRPGFSHVRWRMEPAELDGHPGLVLYLTSLDGDAGFPGNLRVRVTYTVTAANELAIDYHATADAATHVNLTQHAYFNLAGHDAGDVHGHVLELAADRFLPVGDGMIPTGELRAVDGTPFDFREPTPIGARIDAADEQIARGRGYDHCYELRGGLRGVGLAARVFEPVSGRTMTVHTSEPGVQLYTGNWLGDGLTGKGGVMYAPRSGFALETQHFPDSPNRPEFPSTLLRRGAEFRSRTVYAFGVA